MFKPLNYKNEKKPLNSPVERHLEWLNAYICFKMISSHGNLNFPPEFSDGDMYNQRYMSPRVNSLNNVCLKNKVAKSSQTR